MERGVVKKYTRKLTEFDKFGIISILKVKNMFCSLTNAHFKIRFNHLAVWRTFKLHQIFNFRK